MSGRGVGNVCMELEGAHPANRLLRAGAEKGAASLAI